MKLTGVVVVAVVGLSGCLSSTSVTAGPVAVDPAGQSATITPALTSAAPTPSEVSSVRPKPEATGSTVLTFDPPISIKTADDAVKLEGEGISHAFGNFMKLTLGIPDPACPKTVVVSQYRADGFAVGTEAHSCKQSSLNSFWYQSDKIWKPAWSGEGLPDCAALKNAKFPQDFVTGKCLESGKEKTYEP